MQRVTANPPPVATTAVLDGLRELRRGVPVAELPASATTRSWSGRT